VKVKIPPGTVVAVSFSRVTIDFLHQPDAEQFAEWLRWMNDPENDGAEMKLPTLRGKNALMRKTLWTLNIGNYAPELCELTYPLLLGYARKIGADFQIINERRFPEMPVTYEKLQIFYLGRGNDWNVYVDSDAMVFPDFFDVTERLPKDTVAHYGRDFADNRFRADAYFRRDGRNIGACNWFAVASDWCMDLWHPLDHMYYGPLNADALELSTAPGEPPTLKTALAAIKPIVIERQAGIDREHLIDDYVLSRNIARYGLKYKCVLDMIRESGDKGVYTWHTHRMPLAEKVAQMRKGIESLGLDKMDEYRVCKGFPLDAWLAEYGTDSTSRKIQMEDFRITNELQPCDGIAPQDREPCALALGHAGPHSNVGPYRNKPRSMERRASR
jgi:hypothetical protein